MPGAVSLGAYTLFS